jgi:hypothetical protein
LEAARGPVIGSSGRAGRLAVTETPGAPSAASGEEVEAGRVRGGEDDKQREGEGREGAGADEVDEVMLVDTHTTRGSDVEERDRGAAADAVISAAAKECELREDDAAGRGMEGRGRRCEREDAG